MKEPPWSVDSVSLKIKVKLVDLVLTVFSDLYTEPFWNSQGGFSSFQLYSQSPLDILQISHDTTGNVLPLHNKRLQKLFKGKR